MEDDTAIDGQFYSVSTLVCLPATPALRRPRVCVCSVWHWAVRSSVYFVNTISTDAPGSAAASSSSHREANSFDTNCETHNEALTRYLTLRYALAEVGGIAEVAGAAVLHGGVAEAAGA
eukprot:6341079-Prymnesium_polylepis.1